MDTKNNLTIPEQIEELTNLVNCMKKKIEIIEEIQLNKKRKRDDKEITINVKKIKNEQGELHYEIEK